MKTHLCIRPLGFVAISIFATLTPFASQLAAAESAVVVSDPVDTLGKNTWQRISGKWTATGNCIIETSQGGLKATAGKGFWSGGNTNTAPANRGIACYFPGKTFAPGTYTVSFDIGCFTDLPFTDNFVISLIADTDTDSVANWKERIPDSEINIVTDTKPTPGKWIRWTYTFDVFPNTKNVAGAPLIGAPLGFMILSKVPAGSGYAFDNFTITHTTRE
ncbi:hypothetical protein [Geminisphaera colitermitum]|uniref:hypothetical protein n=1 Tax=Geminisphaera colitermitum TaxID=1148786 RepID=UPI000158C522|nr:hypothetical protein [Geminisphaera colitermitum]